METGTRCALDPNCRLGGLFSGARHHCSHYPQSEAVRSVVPANDVIRYALGPVMDVAAMSEESKQIFLALGQHFARHGQLDLFATQILNSLRGDLRRNSVIGSTPCWTYWRAFPEPVLR